MLDDVERVGLLERKRPQQHAVEDAETAVLTPMPSAKVRGATP